MAYAGDMKARNQRRSILHVDLHPFIVSVERTLDPGLRGRPLVIGGDARSQCGIVAAASSEAREAGVRPGQPLEVARRLCPTATFRPGDLQAYARVGQEVTTLLLYSSRRVERPSLDEAFADLTPDSGQARGPVATAEDLKDALQRRLGLDAALGLASSRLAARAASHWARPRGLVVVLPGYERSFLARQAIQHLPDLPPHLERALAQAGLTTLGQVAEADPTRLADLVGARAASGLLAAARGEGEAPVAISTPPASVQEDVVLRTRHPDRPALEAILDELAVRAVRRLRPFDLAAAQLTVEIRRGETSLRRRQDVRPGVADEQTAREVVRSLAAPLLSPAFAVCAVHVRLGRLAPRAGQRRLFPSAV